MDDSVLYGFSLFETILADQGRIPLLRDHWRRLALSAVQIGLQAPSFETFEAELRKHHDSNQVQVLRYTRHKTGGRWSSEPEGCRTTVFVKPYQSAKNAQKRLMLDPQPSPCFDPMRYLKSGSRLAYQHAFQQAVAEGFDDALFWDRDHRLLETSTGNLLIFKDGRWLTPVLSRCLLPGLLRGRLLTEGVVHEANLKLDDLHKAQAVAVCNAVQGVQAVVAINDLTVAPRQEPWFNSMRH